MQGLICLSSFQCIKELRNKAEFYATSKLTPTMDAEVKCVVKSDEMNNDLRNKLLDAVNTLKSAQEGDIQWHPGSGDQVQDLIHPSMHPLVYGKYLFFSFCGKKKS